MLRSDTSRIRARVNIAEARLAGASVEQIFTDVVAGLQGADGPNLAEDLAAKYRDLSGDWA